MPLSVPTRYQGAVQKFDIGARVQFPQGRGKMLRFRDGIRVGSARFQQKRDHVLTVAAAAAGIVLITHPASIKLRLPQNVAESTPEDAAIDTIEIWNLGNAAHHRLPASDAHDDLVGAWVLPAPHSADRMPTEERRTRGE